MEQSVSACLCLGGYGWPADAAEEMDVVPESSSGLFPPWAQPARHCPGCLPAEAWGLEGERLLRCLHSTVVCTCSQILWCYGSADTLKLRHLQPCKILLFNAKKHICAQIKMCRLLVKEHQIYILSSFCINLCPFCLMSLWWMQYIIFHITCNRVLFNNINEMEICLFWFNVWLTDLCFQEFVRRVCSVCIQRVRHQRHFQWGEV